MPCELAPACLPHLCTDLPIDGHIELLGELHNARIGSGLSLEQQELFRYIQSAGQVHSSPGRDLIGRPGMVLPV